MVDFIAFFIIIKRSPSLKLRRLKRGVAQLVAYYVRDVGAGSSSLLTPTNEKPGTKVPGFVFMQATKACF